jgi:hypothetical protein
MLATVRDVEAALRRQVTDDEAGVLPEIIALVEGEIEAYIGRTLTATERTDTFVVQGDEDRLRLASTPVVSVTEVKVDGTVIDVDTYRVRPWGVEFAYVFAVPFGLSGTGTTVEITYVGGLSTTVVGYAALRSIVAGRCARILGVSNAVTSAADPGIVESLSVEGWSVSYRPEAAGRSWTEEETKTLRAFRRPVIV